MPELPEAETIVQQLKKHLKGKQIQSARVLEKSRADVAIEKIMPAPVLQAWRRAKAIIIELDKRQYLLVRLGMTGHFHYAPRGESVGDDEKFAIVKFSLQDGSVLSYTDVRKFGSLRLLTEKQLQQKLAEFGPEPLGKEFTLKLFREMLAKKKKAKIKVTLMDQHFIAGIGNIYAQEALYHAGVLPTRVIGTLKEEETKKLHAAIPKVLQQAVKHNGTTVENYVHIEGAGGFQHYLAVYQKEKCPQGHAITRIVLGGRGTSYCFICQK